MLQFTLKQREIEQAFDFPGVLLSEAVDFIQKMGDIHKTSITVSQKGNYNQDLSEGICNHSTELWGRHLG